MTTYPDTMPPVVPPVVRPVEPHAEPVGAGHLRARVVGERTLAISGAPPSELLEQVRYLLGEGMELREISSAQALDEAAADLSQREREVIGLISRGLSNEEVARSLFLGHNTVKTYIRLAYSKIGAGSRSEAVLWGIRHGLDHDSSA